MASREKKKTFGVIKVSLILFAAREGNRNLMNYLVSGDDLGSKSKLVIPCR